MSKSCRDNDVILAVVIGIFLIVGFYTYLTYRSHQPVHTINNFTPITHDTQPVPARSLNTESIAVGGHISAHCGSIIGAPFNAKY